VEIASIVLKIFETEPHVGIDARDIFLLRMKAYRLFEQTESFGGTPRKVR
jgi:hypothetical protein